MKFSKNTVVGCHFLLQGIFPTQGLNSFSYVTCIGRGVLYHWAPREAHMQTVVWIRGHQSGQWPRSMTMSSGREAKGHTLAPRVYWNVRGRWSHLICWRTLPHLLRILKTIPLCVIRELSFFAMQLCVCVCAQSLSRVWLFVTTQTAARQAPLSMGFPMQKYWSRLQITTPGDLPTQGSNSCLLCLLHWQADALK